MKKSLIFVTILFVSFFGCSKSEKNKIGKTPREQVRYFIERTFQIQMIANMFEAEFYCGSTEFDEHLKKEMNNIKKSFPTFNPVVKFECYSHSIYIETTFNDATFPELKGIKIILTREGEEAPWKCKSDLPIDCELGYMRLK